MTEGQVVIDLTGSDSREGESDPSESRGLSSASLAEVAAAADTWAKKNSEENHGSAAADDDYDDILADVMSFSSKPSKSSPPPQSSSKKQHHDYSLIDDDDDNDGEPLWKRLCGSMSTEHMSNAELLAMIERDQLEGEKKSRTESLTSQETSKKPKKEEEEGEAVDSSKPKDYHRLERLRRNPSKQPSPPETEDSTKKAASEKPKPLQRTESGNICSKPVVLLGQDTDPDGAVESALKEKSFSIQHCDFAIPFVQPPT